MFSLRYAVDFDVIRMAGADDLTRTGSKTGRRHAAGRTKLEKVAAFNRKRK
jgi:hypothetical protein